eukprot:CAMPEP_0173440738 /NCGR_PEP_ID=MMETSP1357-20121228/23514_1 /TAXON_ID=77926 /ORGANISM="Hemiselmis rufescens, Strain PCC563" /LENGTH=76 /DNA_ID=CAMNT_0014406273 /DNA_START=31 /DNA_END=258 /DNA_ORIENTATION=-
MQKYQTRCQRLELQLANMQRIVRESQSVVNLSRLHSGAGHSFEGDVDAVDPWQEKMRRFKSIQEAQGGSENGSMEE